MRNYRCEAHVAVICALLVFTACSSANSGSDSPNAPSTRSDAGVVTDAGTDSETDADLPGDDISTENPDDTNTTANADLAAFTNTAATAICEAMLRCCDTSSTNAYFAAMIGDEEYTEAGIDVNNVVPPAAVYSSVEECAEVVTDLLNVKPFGDWVTAAKAGRVAYDAEKTKECLGELAAASCGDDMASAITDTTCFGLAAPYPPEKRRMFTRTSVLGDECHPIRDGVGSRFFGNCKPEEAFCCYQRDDGQPGCAFPFNAEGVPRVGVCQYAPAEAESCSGMFNDIVLCRTGLDCSVDNVCEAPLSAVLGVGDACYDDGFSILGYCKDSFCDSATKTCTPFGQIGDACIAPNECESNACNAGQCTENTFCTGLN